MATELSATGTVLAFLGGACHPRFRREGRFCLDLFVPGASSPVRAAVRPVRPVGNGHAFEFVGIAAPDRLTLAEYLDRLMAKSARRNSLEFTRWRHR